MTEAVVVDASVALKWFLTEDDSDRAERLMATRDLLAPSLILSEVGNGLWSKRIASSIDLELAQDMMAKLPRLFREIVPIEQLMSPAIEIAYELEHPIYDCLYLAVARERGLLLVTADQRFITKVAGSALAASVTPLVQVSP